MILLFLQRYFSLNRRDCLAGYWCAPLPKSAPGATDKMPLTGIRAADNFFKNPAVPWLTAGNHINWLIGIFEYFFPFLMTHILSYKVLLFCNKIIISGE